MRRLALALLLAGCGGAATGGGGGPFDAEVDAAPDAEPADAAPLTRLWYVAPGGDGDGSRDRPFGDAAAAYAAARAGDTVVLLPGEHPAPGLPPPDVTLTGVGADATRILGPWRLDGPAVARELSVSGDPALTVAAAVELDAVAITGRLVVEAGALTARDLSGRGVIEVAEAAALSARGGEWAGEGRGLVSAGATTLDGVRLSAPGGDAAVVEGGEATFEATVIRDAAVGVRVTGGRLTVRDGRFEALSDPGAIGGAVRVEGGEATLVAVVIEDIDRGIRVDAGGSLVGDGVLVRGPRTDGVSMQGGVARIDGLRVEGAGNTGVAAVSGARLTLGEAVIEGAGRIGILVDGSTLDGEGVLVVDAAERGVSLLRAVADLDGLAVRAAGNVGVQITDPAGRVRLADATISGCGTTGIGVFGDGGPVEFEGLVVEGTVVGEGDLGEGVHIYQASARLAGVIARDNARAGVLFEQAAGTISDARLTGNGDPGLVVLEARAPISAAGVVAEANGGAGLLVLASELAVADVRAVGNRAQIGLGPGHGLAVALGGSLTVERGDAEDNAGSGISYDPATRGRVSGMALRGNRDFGLSTACGAAVEEGEGNRFADNGRGERGGCP